MMDEDPLLEQAKNLIQRRDLAGQQPRPTSDARTGLSPDDLHAQALAILKEKHFAQALELLVAHFLDRPLDYRNLKLLCYTLNNLAGKLDRFKLAADLIHAHDERVAAVVLAMTQLETWDGWIEIKDMVQDVMGEGPGLSDPSVEKKLLWCSGLTQVGNVLKSHGETRVAQTYYAKALALAPDDQKYNLFSNLVLNLHYYESDIIKLTKQIRQVNALVPKVKRAMHAVSKRKDKRLKVGYVSADFRNHPVGYFMMPVFASHDRQSFDVVCYSSTPKEDNITQTIKKMARNYFNVGALSDKKLAERIARDKIDILVNLAGHSANHRLGAFHLRPAPIQICGGGHFSSTGMQAMDYLMADDNHIPQDLRPFYNEKLVVMRDSYTCCACPDTPISPDLPMDINGYVTFGSLNNLAKLSEACIALWSDVLKAVEGSKLLLSARQFRSQQARSHIEARFQEYAIGPERLILEQGGGHGTFLRTYDRIDIALDSTPYSGGLTTIEALWMGAPVITHAAQSFASRHSLGHLSVVGHPEFVAISRDDYVHKALSLVAHPQRLRDFRKNIRVKMRASPLLDAKGYTKSLEEFYKALWAAHCGEN